MNLDKWPPSEASEIENLLSYNDKVWNLFFGTSVYINVIIDNSGYGQPDAGKIKDDIELEIT